MSNLRFNPTSIVLALVGVVAIVVLGKLHLYDAALGTAIAAIVAAAQSNRAVRKNRARATDNMIPPQAPAVDPHAGLLKKTCPDCSDDHPGLVPNLVVGGTWTTCVRCKGTNEIYVSEPPTKAAPIGLGVLLLFFFGGFFGCGEHMTERAKNAEIATRYGYELAQCERSILDASLACVAEAGTREESRTCREVVAYRAEKESDACACAVNSKWGVPCKDGGR